jgi:basic membrane protein A and related proteins
LLLVQAGATGVRPVVESTPTPTATCVTSFRVTFVTDVSGPQSAVDGAGWRGVGEALRQLPCAHAEQRVSRRPGDYLTNLQTAADQHADLVIAGSFLLTDAVVDAARANPTTHFMLVDPIVVPASQPNLLVLSFRQDQAAFLAGALAGIVTTSGIVAGVYGPGGAIDGANRTGFEDGARYARPGVRVLGAFQPADAGAPYANPEWGASQARVFLAQGADVIFGAGGTTGVGALLAAAPAGRACIGADAAPGDDPATAPCLLATTVKFIDVGVRDALTEAAASPWTGGLRVLGFRDGDVGLRTTSSARLTPKLRQRLIDLERSLASGDANG